MLIILGLPEKVNAWVDYIIELIEVPILANYFEPHSSKFEHIKNKIKEFNLLRQEVADVRWQCRWIFHVSSLDRQPVHVVFQTPSDNLKQHLSDFPLRDANQRYETPVLWPSLAMDQPFKQVTMNLLQAYIKIIFFRRTQFIIASSKWNNTYQTFSRIWLWKYFEPNDGGMVAEHKLMLGLLAAEQ